MNQKINILITDGENRSSLAATRSLGRKGYRVVVCGNHLINISSASKYCSRRYRTSNSLDSDSSFIQDILEIIKKENINIIIPMSEKTIMMLLANKSNFPPEVKIASPEIQKVEKIFDKIELFKIAEDLAIPMPKTMYIHNKQDLLDKAAFIEQYPVVIKPGYSSRPLKKGFISSGVLYAKTKEELLWQYQNNPVLRYPSMIQKRVTGPGTGLFTIFDKNNHLCIFCHERVLEKPPSGGVGVICRSVPVDNDMVEAAHALLSAVEWTGVAMVEFKRDMTDGTPKLMEVNGRFWGSLQLAVSSGVDFPCLLIDYLLGKKVHKSDNKYIIDQKLKWIFGIVDHLIIRLKNKDSSLNLPMNYPSKKEIIKNLVNIFEKNCSYDSFDSKDIQPFIVELRDYCSNLLRR